jgi:hypothetical protein
MCFWRNRTVSPQPPEMELQDNEVRQAFSVKYLRRITNERAATYAERY